jgi:hypothetical protein
MRREDIDYLKVFPFQTGVSSICLLQAQQVFQTCSMLTWKNSRITSAYSLLARRMDSEGRISFRSLMRKGKNNFE